MDKALVYLRGSANLMGIASYVLMVNGLVVHGVGLNLAAQGFMSPWVVKNKAWDMLATGAFFTAINLHRLLS